MAWRTKVQKRQKRGNAVVGARLVFDNGLPETVRRLNPAHAFIPDIADPEGPPVSNGEDEFIDAPNPDYESEEMVWGRDPDRTDAQFRKMIVVERDAWLAHFDRQAQPNQGITEVNL